MARERIEEDWTRDLRVKEQELRWICGTVAASAGNAKGAKAASRIELFDREPEDLPIPSVAQVEKMFGPLPPEEPGRRIILPGE